MTDAWEGTLHFFEKHPPGIDAKHYPINRSFRVREVLSSDVSPELVAEAISIVKQLAHASPQETYEKGEGEFACLSCDMGYSGRSTYGRGHHDNDCIGWAAQRLVDKLQKSGG